MAAIKRLKNCVGVTIGITTLKFEVLQIFVIRKKTQFIIHEDWKSEENSEHSHK